jgi:opacity protein-like surface antigen
MKKIAILGAVLALSTSAIADDNSLFYIKAGASGSIGHKTYDDSKFENQSFNGNKLGCKKEDNKYGEFTFGGTIGAGYQLMDNVRVELQGSYFAGPKWKYEVAAVAASAAGAVPVVAASPKINVELEASGFAVLLSPAVDLIDMGPAKLYVTGGAGISYVKLKSKVTIDVPNTTIPEMEWESKVRFAWSVGAGVAFEVSPGVSIDVGYSFTDLGKPAKEDFKEIEIDVAGAKTKLKEEEFGGNNLRSHNVNVGVRFSL